MTKECKTGISLAGLGFLFLVNFGTMQDMVILPAANEIFAAFPDAPQWMMNFILTGPMLVGTITQLGVGLLMRRFRKKTLLLVFWAAFAVTSIAGAAVQDPAYLMVMRALSGLSIGGLIPLAVALIAQQYPDKVRRGEIIGYFYAAMAVCGAAESMLSGQLASIDWTMVYYIYLVAVPVFFGLLAFLPKTPVEEDKSGQDDAVQAVDREDRVVNPLLSAVLTGLSAALVAMIYGIIVFQASLVIGELGIGGASEAGFASALGTVMSAVTGVLFGVVFGRLGRFTPAVFYWLIAAGSLILFAYPCTATLYVSVVVMGFGYGLSMPYFSTKASTLASVGNNPILISVVLALMSCGTFLSPYFADFLMGVIGVSTRVGTVPATATIAIIAGVVTLVGGRYVKKKAARQ